MRLRRQKNLSDPVSVVSRFVDAANRHDAEGIAKCLHPEFESIQPIYPARNFRGSAQVRRNWQAIFESEPGFRLSLVRAASADNTVWVELHGAGADVEVAGVFIMGVEGDLVRWARVYSSVVEQVGPRVAAPDPERPIPAEEQAASMAEEAARIRAPGRRRPSNPHRGRGRGGGRREADGEAAVADKAEEDEDRLGRGGAEAEEEVAEEGVAEDAVEPAVEAAVEAAEGEPAGHGPPPSWTKS